jgi:predicted lipoprotein with Yx(FWY)xxD motif
MKHYAGFIAAIALAAGCASMDGAPVKSDGGVLTGDNGMTLYTFDKDPAGGGKSVCNGACTANWPPLMAKADAKPSGEFSTITRDDGSKQWAWKGKPLYYFAKDQKPGDKNGDGFLNNAWHVIKASSGGY